ncbi:MAG TPA: bifunctional UDP-N-acetylglucosamine diphosphorylase/glucosamine-1-phosphate N-acetyltransferase GlmU [Halothiobacillus sp.]|nr:bifunctional UDP-N-acetylglucosamine diphosphorylase/glucosamine-1-phosphate N-acetyltransferase GlmU [Halothiobacillus sp.]
MSSTSQLHVLVLAAGKGTRMRSDLPKVLHTLAGRTMLDRVLDAADSVQPASVFVVLGFGASQVEAAITRPGVRWVLQAEQLGTGHAVRCALDESSFADDDRVLILYGDIPLLDASVVQPLVDASLRAPLTVMTTVLSDPTGYGRIIRNATQAMVAIREQKDATLAEQGIAEINTGLMCVRAGLLRRWLAQLAPQNAQGELYLTDIVGMAHAEDVLIEGIVTPDPVKVTGVNDRWALAQLEREWQLRQAKALALAGTTILDPARLDIRGEVTIGRDVTIDVNVILEGRVVLGNDVVIGPNCVIRNATLGNGVHVHAFSHIDGANLAEDVVVGPYARLRPGTELARGSRIGNFVEIKASRIGAGSKINHLSYVGDTVMGAECNVGAGTITCNYDGANKHRTTIGDRVFVGSSSQLVAPVVLGSGATIAAGSTITKNVPEDQLALARAPQVLKAGWRRPVKKKDV